LFALLFLALALRLYRLDYSSLRGDEAFDVLFAAQPVSEIIYQDTINQIYPPFYHTTLHFWMLVAGRSEFAYRFIAVAFGVWLVALTYRFGRDLFGAPAGLLAAFLSALHPFYLWHSQDGRMYTMLPALALASTWLAWRAWGKPESIRRWLVYILVATSALYVHYFAYLAHLAQNVAAFIAAWRERWSRRQLARWLASQFVIALLVLPWLAFTYQQIVAHQKAWIPPVSPGDVLARALLAYSLGPTMAMGQAIPWLVGFIAIVLVGLLPWRSDDAASLRSTFLLLFIPLAAVYLGSLARPMFDEKFLGIVVPFYTLLLARGLTWFMEKDHVGAWARVIAPLMLLWLASGMAVSDFNLYFVPAHAKSPPWRELAQAIHRRAETGDVIVYNYPDPSLMYYNAERYPIFLQPTNLPVDSAATLVELQRLARDYRRVWLVPTRAATWDADGFVEHWFDRYADKIETLSAGTLRANLYLTPPTFYAQMRVLNLSLADNVELVGYRLDAEQVRAGGVAKITLYWRAAGKIEKDYTVFTHLLDATGFLRAQQDNPPVGGTYPTRDWVSHQTIVDKYALSLPANLAAGPYRFEIGMYDASGKRLAILDAQGRSVDDKVLLEPIMVVAP